MIKEEEKSEIPNIEDYHYYIFSQEFDNNSCSDAMRFILARNLMTGKSRPKCIKMIINSPGGSLSSAFALIDTMKGSKIPIYTYGLGEIASCGLLTFMSGEKGHRYITKNTSILSHQFFWCTIGKEHELHASVKEFNNTSQRVIEHYKCCTKQSETTIKKHLLPPEDVWLTPREAIKYGIADHLVQFY